MPSLTADFHAGSRVRLTSNPARIGAWGEADNPALPRGRASFAERTEFVLGFAFEAVPAEGKRFRAPLCLA